MARVVGKTGKTKCQRTRETAQPALRQIAAQVEAHSLPDKTRCRLQTPRGRLHGQETRVCGRIPAPRPIDPLDYTCAIRRLNNCNQGRSQRGGGLFGLAAVKFPPKGWWRVGLFGKTDTIALTGARACSFVCDWPQIAGSSACKRAFVRHLGNCPKSYRPSEWRKGH